jgi:hypothetical protein
MSNFGSLTDHFGILAIESGDGDLDDVFKLVASSKVPQAMSRADANNETGDPEAATWYGNSDGALFDASTTFALVTGSFSLAVLKLGEIALQKVVTGIEIGTSNDGWPQITFTGVLGTKTIVAPGGTPAWLNTWTLPAITVTGYKRAQLLDFTIGAACRLTASGLSFSVELAQQEDGLGEPAAHGLSGGIATQTAELVRVTGACTWTKGATWEETQAPGADEGQAAYHTASAAAEKLLVRDASA